VYKPALNFSVCAVYWVGGLSRTVISIVVWANVVRSSVADRNFVDIVTRCFAWNAAEQN